jgi:hypothetical protein
MGKGYQEMIDPLTEVFDLLSLQELDLRYKELKYPKLKSELPV